mmetsp:Transcript_44861/g.89933  ORF Transcript_44861/g.89933 Transcript_44861/m.89933 type:complete len:172 (-) Transcript_44861:804-1319(-)
MSIEKGDPMEIECKICLTLHKNTKSFWIHIKGRKHLENKRYLDLNNDKKKNKNYQNILKKRFIRFPFRILKLFLIKERKGFIVTQFLNQQRNFEGGKNQFFWAFLLVLLITIIKSPCGILIIFSFLGFYLELPEFNPFIKRLEFSERKKTLTREEFFSIGLTIKKQKKKAF